LIGGETWWGRVASGDIWGQKIIIIIKIKNKKLNFEEELVGAPMRGKMFAMATTTGI
jgi:hypothetical protein